MVRYGPADFPKSDSQFKYIDSLEDKAYKFICYGQPNGLCQNICDPFNTLRIVGQTR